MILDNNISITDDLREVRAIIGDLTNDFRAYEMQINDETKPKLENLLDKPQFIRGNQVDRIFKKLGDELLSSLNANDNIETLYRSVGAENNEQFIKKLLGYLLEIHEATCEVQSVDSTDDNEKIIPISLHDIRDLELLVRLIIIHGIDANLPPSLKLPHDLKMLQDMKKYSWCNRLPKAHEPHSYTLQIIVKTLYPIFEKPRVRNDYLRSVLLSGPLYTSVLVAIINICVTIPLQGNLSLFDSFEILQQTYELFTIYTLIIRDCNAEEARCFVLEKLSTLPVRRSNGVVSLIDFVTGARENEQIDLEKINRVTEILVAKPKSLSRVAYFSKLFPQVYEELSYINRPIVINCLNGLVSTFYAKNPKIVIDFLFKRIYSVLFNQPLKSHSSGELNRMINVLISLAKNSSTEVIEALIISQDRNNFYLHLWVYALFLRKYQKISPTVIDESGEENYQETTNYYNVILSLLKSFILLTGHLDAINVISLNLVNFQHDRWKYSIDFESQLPYISVDDKMPIINEDISSSKTKAENMSEIFQDIDLAIELFVKLLKLINNINIIKDIFISILSRWIKKTSSPEHNRLLKDDPGDNMLVLIDMKTLEFLNKEFQTSIVQSPGDVLIMISELIDFVTQNHLEEQKREEDSDDEESDSDYQNENTNSGFEIVVGLLTTILQNSKDSELQPFRKVLSEIDKSLCDFNDKSLNALHTRIEDVLKSKMLVSDDDNDNCKKDQILLDRAVANISDPSEPIKVQGLQQLVELARKGTKVISLERVLSFQLQYLKHSDPFIYLNSIKGITVLCQIASKKVIPSILKVYLNDDGRYTLDDVLKIGEILINFIQRENQLFEGPTANFVIDACLIHVRKHSKLDEKIRMSSLSVLGVALETNPRGIQSRIADVLDCAFGILQLENQGNTSNSFLVRRAATRLLHDLIYSTGTTLLPEQYDYSNMMRLLNHIHYTDTDPLVREQADTILKELQDLTI